MEVHDFYYDLPEELIAQDPLEKRDESRFMVIHRDTDEIEHRRFHDVIEYLNPDICSIKMLKPCLSQFDNSFISVFKS